MCVVVLSFWDGGCSSLTGGAKISRQVKFAVVNFAVGNFAEPPGFCVVPPARVPSVHRWCARNSRRTPEFRVGNFAVNLKREISHAKLKCHEIPLPPVPHKE